MSNLALRSYVLTALCAILLTACIGEQPSPSAGRGTFAFELATDSLTADIVTRAPRQLTDAEAAAYRVTLHSATETIWENIPFADITLADRTQPLGTGYVVSAENISAADAESLNSGWGARRYAGSSAPFAITEGQTTHVTVPCTMANAGLCVTFDDSFTSYFTEYAVTTADTRALKFNADNAFPANTTLPSLTGEGSGVGPAVAYYNTSLPSLGEGSGVGQLTADVALTITASAGWDGTVRLTRTLTLQAGKITRLEVKLNAPQPSTGNISLMAITYDDHFTEGSTEEITLE